MRKQIKISKPRSGLVIYLTEEAGSYLGGYGTRVSTIYVSTTREFVISADNMSGSSISINKKDHAHPMRLTFTANNEVPLALPFCFGTEHVEWQTDGKATIRFVLPPQEQLNPPVAIFRGPHKPREKKQPAWAKPVSVTEHFNKFVEEAAASLSTPSDRNRLIESAKTFNDLRPKFPGIKWTLTSEGLEGREDVLK